MQAIQLDTRRVLPSRFPDQLISTLVLTSTQCNWEVDDNLPVLNTGSAETPNPAPSGKKVKVSFLCEQTSHHPPVSAWWVDCPEKGVVARGYDQLSAKFTGTSVKVFPGNHNLGIYVSLTKRGEEYHFTHPAAYLGGLLKGMITFLSICDSSDSSQALSAYPSPTPAQSRAKKRGSKSSLHTWPRAG